MTKIRDTSKTAPRVAPELVAKALGANAAPRPPRGNFLPELDAVQKEIAARLASSGGRPGLEGVERRQKIPLSDEDWERLVWLAEQLKEGEVRPSPAQVASVLLRQALSQLTPQRAKELLKEHDSEVAPPHAAK
jgi:hypothetical protein